MLISIKMTSTFSRPFSSSRASMPSSHSPTEALFQFSELLPTPSVRPLNAAAPYLRKRYQLLSNARLHLLKRDLPVWIYRPGEKCIRAGSPPLKGGPGLRVLSSRGAVLPSPRPLGEGLWRSRAYAQPFLPHHLLGDVQTFLSWKLERPSLALVLREPSGPGRESAGARDSRTRR